jgi:hypothetical protein
MTEIKFLYPIGEFVSYKKYICLKPNTKDVWEGNGIIVSMRNEIIQEGYFNFKKKKRYNVCVPKFNGDIMILYEEDIKKNKLSLQEKISMIANFYENWYYYHKEIYQELIIKAIKN